VTTISETLSRNETLADWAQEVLDRRALVQSSFDYIPHPGQLEFHSDTHRIRACFTGNRWGKSFAAAHEVDWWCGGDHPYRQAYSPPVRVRCIADGFDYGVEKILIPIFKQTINPKRLVGRSWESGYAAGKHEIHYANGSVIQFMSYSQKDQGRAAQKFEGDVLDLFWPDEHCPFEIVEACRARIGSRPVHEIYTLTPILGKTWEYDDLYTAWQKATNLDVAVFEGEGTDNPHVSGEGLQSLYGAIRDPNMLRVRKGGEWINVGGAVYGAWNTDVHFIRYDPEIVKRLTKTTIIDPHPSKPEAILWCGIDITNKRYAYREALLRLPVPMVADQIRARSAGERIDRWIFDNNWNWTDKDSGKSKREMYEDARIGPFLPGHENQWDRIERLRWLLNVPGSGGPMLYVMDSCPELAEQIQRNRFKPQTEAMKEGDRWTRIEERDDLLDCLEYYGMSDDVYLGGGGVTDPMLAHRAAMRVAQERESRGI
jgi:hypothetical protein